MNFNQRLVCQVLVVRFTIPDAGILVMEPMCKSISVAKPLRLHALDRRAEA